jgi:hypothetical protein
VGSLHVDVSEPLGFHSAEFLFFFFFLICFLSFYFSVEFL